MNFNKESVIGILFHLQSVPLYTLLVKISIVESDEIVAKWRKAKPAKIKTNLNLWPTKIWTT